MSARIQLLEATYKRLTTYQKYHVRSFCQYPKVGHNAGYMIGYMVALHENDLIAYEDYTYWLAFFGTPQDELLAHVLTMEK